MFGFESLLPKMKINTCLSRKKHCNSINEFQEIMYLMKSLQCEGGEVAELVNEFLVAPRPFSFLCVFLIHNVSIINILFNELNKILYGHIFCFSFSGKSGWRIRMLIDIIHIRTSSCNLRDVDQCIPVLIYTFVQTQSRQEHPLNSASCVPALTFQIHTNILKLF